MIIIELCNCISSLAPSPPRDVVARLVAPLTVEVTWRSPAVPSGAISHYIVYAIPLRSANVVTGEGHQQSESSTTPPQTLQMVYISYIAILLMVCNYL